VQATPCKTVERDVQRKTKKLVQFQNYAQYPSVAQKTLTCMKKAEPPREPAMLPGRLLGHSRRIHRGRTELSPAAPGVRSAVGRWQKTAPRPQAQNPF